MFFLKEIKEKQTKKTPERLPANIWIQISGARHHDSALAPWQLPLFRISAPSQLFLEIDKKTR